MYQYFKERYLNCRKIIRYADVIFVTHPNIFSQFKDKESSDMYPTGFVFNSNSIFIATNIGKLIVVDIKSGKIKNISKIDSGLISRPFVQNQSMYLVKDNSIIKLN